MQALRGYLDHLSFGRNRWRWWSQLVLITLALTGSLLAQESYELFPNRPVWGTADEFSRSLLSPLAASDEEPLATDRPDFTEASSVVGLGRVLLEGGYTYVQDKDKDTKKKSHAFPQNLLRIGITERVELRVVWDEGYLWERETDRATTTHADSDGATDILIGTKIQLTDEAGWIPESALISTISLPVGSSSYQADTIETRFNLLYGWELSDDWSVAGSTGLSFLAEPGDHFTQIHQSATVGYSITEKLGCYTEWFSLFNHTAEDSRPEHYINGGLTYKFTPNFQVDWRLGFGIGDAADDLFTGVGYGIRW